MIEVFKRLQDNIDDCGFGMFLCSQTSNYKGYKCNAISQNDDVKFELWKDSEPKSYTHKISVYDFMIMKEETDFENLFDEMLENKI